MPHRHLRIGIAVPGRFHAFGLARGLSDLGHGVTVFTNYPRFAVKRFQLAGAAVRPFVSHGIVLKAVSRLGAKASDCVERPLHSLFGRWAAREFAKEHWDITYSFSGVAE